MSEIGKSRGARNWLVAAVLLLVALALMRGQITTMSPRSSAAVASLVIIALMAVHVRVALGRGITVGLGYAALAALFHGGLLIPLAASGSVDLFNERDSRWFHSSLLPEAAWLSCLGLLAFTVGYLALDGPARPPSRRHLGQGGSDRVGLFGFALTATGILAWVWWVYQAGSLTFGTSYIAFLAQTSNVPLPYAYLAMGIGLPIAATNDKAWRPALALFALWSLQAFVLGLRGEVLLPGIAAFIVRSRQHPIRLWPVGVTGIAMLTLGAFVRSVRVAGFSASRLELASFNPLDGLIELGYSIRPLVVALQWRQTGEAPVGLATYWNPIARPLGLAVPEVENDPAALGSMVNQRVGAIGGSPIAEAFRSGGPLVVLLVLALIGVLCALLDGARRAANVDARVGATAFVLLLWVRNDFVAVPAQLMAVLVITSMAGILAGPDRPKRPFVGRRTLGKQAGPLRVLGRASTHDVGTVNSAAQRTVDRFSQ